MKYRNEWKYVISNNEIEMIQNKLDKVLNLDEHAKDGIYVIHSLYFDDLNSTCMRENDAGSFSRFKWRIRYYGEEKSYITLERKEKLFGMCRKKTCRLSLDDYEKIISNQISDLLWSTDNKLLKLFCVDILDRRFEPKVIIDYERKAYVELVSNVRITFDMNISASNEVDKFLDGGYLKYPITNKDEHVLEIKFDDILPSYVKQATYIGTLRQDNFSKYYLGRQLLG